MIRRFALYQGTAQGAIPRRQVASGTTRNVVIVCRMVHRPVGRRKTAARQSCCGCGVAIHTSGRARDCNMVGRFNHDSGVTRRMAGFATARKRTVIHAPGGEAGLVGMTRIAGDAVDARRDRDMASRQ